MEISGVVVLEGEAFAFPRNAKAEVKEEKMPAFPIR